MLGQPEDNRQLVVTPGSGNRMQSSGHTLVPVVGFPRSRREGAILKEEGLVSKAVRVQRSALSELCPVAAENLGRRIVSNSRSA